ncbi:hypothetical protein MMC14_004065 [Varicellaria rhodocarpa]|nr:hypothetical protein [Varicellaria rhodocarpa]
MALPPQELGQSIPADTAHAVSVSLPTWKACVGYEEGEDWVLSKMKQAYPRFYIHNSIQAFVGNIVSQYGNSDETAMLFPSTSSATRCVEFIMEQSSKSYLQGRTVTEKGKNIRSVELVFKGENFNCSRNKSAVTMIVAVLFPTLYYAIAKMFWQHSGEGVSSRRAEFYHKAFEEGHLISRDDLRRQTDLPTRVGKGPRRYQRGGSVDLDRQDSRSRHTSDSDFRASDQKDYAQFVEERFGRNLDLSLAATAKVAIRRRIAGVLIADLELDESIGLPADPMHSRKVPGFSVDDVYLFPAGMNAIFSTHRIMLSVRGVLESISYGFPYIDTLKVLEKWGPGCLFYGHGSSIELDDLEKRCKAGQRFLAFFCEFPGNPLLRCPDLHRVRSLADQYDFAVVIDETIGNIMNVHLLPSADVVVSSLTKIFSGDSNVMGGSAVLNPQGRYYKLLKKAFASEYEDNFWAEDAVFMERNSRDFIPRIDRINANAEAICKVLHESPHSRLYVFSQAIANVNKIIVKEVYYPKYGKTRRFYDMFRSPNGGYGGLFSVTFHSTSAAVTFFDAIEIAKGPSLGTNFTLCSPYTLLAHYGELDWAASFGVEADLIRISVGLEDKDDLIARVKRVLAVMDIAQVCI